MLLRLILTLFGGYVAAAGLVASVSATLPLAGMARSEAVVLASMLGFVFYLVLVLWGFTERRLWRLCMGLAFLAGSGFGLIALIPHAGG